VSNYRNILEAYLKTLNISCDRVADVGGGALPVKDRVKSWDVKTYHIWDSQLEDQKQLPEYIQNFNRPIERDDNHPYDVVFMLEVSEYLWNPRQAMVNINYLLRPGGIAYISFCYLYPVHEPKQADYLRYTCDGAARLLGEAKLKVIDIISRDMTPAGFTAYKQYMKAEGFHASKHSRHDQLGFIFKCVKE